MRRPHASIRPLSATAPAAPADWQSALRLLRGYSYPGAAAQLAVIERMRLSPSGDPLELPAERKLSDRPHVSAFPALFSPANATS